MIIGIHGEPRSGKTLLAVLLLLLDFLKKRLIISSISLTNIHYEPLNLSRIESMELQNCTVFLDEAYTLLDCRLSQSAASRMTSYFIFQSGKNDVDIIYTSQIAHSVDLRLYNLANVKILAQKVMKQGIKNPFSNRPDPKDINHFQYVAIPSFRKPREFRITGENAFKIYPYFDTYQNVVKNIPTKKSRARQTQLIFD